MADEPTMRDALTAAYKEHEEDAPLADESAPDPIDSTPAEETAPPSEKDAGGETPSDAGSTPTPPVIASPVEANKPAIASGPAPKPPRAWSAEAKAAFGTLPEPVKQDVLRREKEISQGLELAAPARKHYEAFNEVTKPFQPLFDAYGVQDPLPTIRELLTARATLEIGTPEQKAAFIGNLIHEFGIDIGTLDNLLLQRGPVQNFQPARPAPPPNYRADPALAPLYAIAEQMKQATYEKAEATVASLASLPHFEDVRDDMANVIEHFAAQGKSITPENAYKRASGHEPRS
jgi:hypothetical protein